MIPTTVVYLGRRQADDAALAARLGRALAAGAQAGGRFALVHGAGDDLARAVEGRAGALVWTADAPAPARPEDGPLVGRFLRETNRSLAARLSEEGLACTGLQGSDRGLLRLAGGALRAAPGIVEALLERGVAAVVSALAALPEGVAALSPADAAAALAAALRGPVRVVCLTQTDRLGVVRAGALAPRLPLGEAEPADGLPEAAVLRRLASAGLPLFATGTTALTAPEPFRGTLLVT